MTRRNKGGTKLGPVIPLAEENVRVDKVERQTAIVRVRTKIATKSAAMNIPLIREEIQVKRVEIGRYVDATPAIRQEDGVVIVPILEEVPVIEKRLILRAELHITRCKHNVNQRREIQLRRTEPVIEEERKPARRKSRS